MEGQEKLYSAELETIDVDLGFLFFIVLAVLLSYWATVRQRDALCLTLLGETEQAACVGDVSAIRLGASALIVGSLGFLFMQALATCRNAGPDDPTACRSARNNLLASFFVLLAALIRLLDFNFVRRAQPSLDNTLPPS